MSKESTTHLLDDMRENKIHIDEQLFREKDECAITVAEFAIITPQHSGIPQPFLWFKIYGLLEYF